MAKELQPHSTMPFPGAKAVPYAEGQTLKDTEDDLVLGTDKPIAGETGERGCHLPVMSQGSKKQWLPLLQDPQRKVGK